MLPVKQLMHSLVLNNAYALTITASNTGIRCEKSRSNNTVHLTYIFFFYWHFASWSQSYLPQCKALLVKSQIKCEARASILGQNISLINTECDSVIHVSDILLNSPSAGCWGSKPEPLLWQLDCCSGCAVTAAGHCHCSLLWQHTRNYKNAPVFYNLILIPCISICVPLVVMVHTFFPARPSLKYLIFYLFQLTSLMTHSILSQTSFLTKPRTWN